jgi:hypothetical protein
VCCVACQQGGGTASVCALYVVYVVGTVRCTVRCVCVVQWEVSQRLFQVWILGLYYISYRGNSQLIQYSKLQPCSASKFSANLEYKSVFLES